MMILLHADALPRLMQRLQGRFYTPRGIPFEAHVCTPVAGAGLLSVAG